MKEELLKKLLELINRSDAFLTGQGPEFAAEIITYGKASTAIWLCALVLFLACSLTIFFKSIKTMKEDVYESLPSFLGVCFGGIFSVFLVMGIFDQCREAVKIVFAPKLYLIEQIKDALK